jgi:coronin-7
VCFHPAAHGILTTSSGTTLNLWDLTIAADIFSWDGHGDRVQSVAWQWGPGRLVASQARDKQLRLLDPRAATPLVAETASHDGVKDSKVVWVGEQRLLTSGFSADRSRELILRDTRQLRQPQHVLSLDVSSGILVPLYDPDTNMIFLSGTIKMAYYCPRSGPFLPAYIWE